MALSTEWVALKTGQSGSGGVEYSESKEEFVIIYFIMKAPSLVRLTPLLEMVLFCFEKYL